LVHEKQLKQNNPADLSYVREWMRGGIRYMENFLRRVVKRESVIILL